MANRARQLGYLTAAFATGLFTTALPAIAGGEFNILTNQVKYIQDEDSYLYLTAFDQVINGKRSSSYGESCNHRFPIFGSSGLVVPLGKNVKRSSEIARSLNQNSRTPEIDEYKYRGLEKQITDWLLETRQNQVKYFARGKKYANGIFVGFIDVVPAFKKCMALIDRSSSAMSLRARLDRAGRVEQPVAQRTTQSGGTCEQQGKRYRIVGSDYLCLSDYEYGMLKRQDLDSDMRMYERSNDRYRRAIERHEDREMREKERRDRDYREAQERLRRSIPVRCTGTANTYSSGYGSATTYGSATCY